MTNRKRHPHKEIEKVVAYAESLDWRVIEGSGHAWAYLYCPRADRSGCKVGVWSTPKNPENHARQVRRQVDSCPHRSKADIAEDGKD
jgi:hypothetical protein